MHAFSFLMLSCFVAILWAPLYLTETDEFKHYLFTPYSYSELPQHFLWPKPLPPSAPLWCPTQWVMKIILTNVFSGGNWARGDGGRVAHRGPLSRHDLSSPPRAAVWAVLEGDGKTTHLWTWPQLWFHQIHLVMPYIFFPQCYSHRKFGWLQLMDYKCRVNALLSDIYVMQCIYQQQSN